jgi:hypothetical protein
MEEALAVVLECLPVLGEGADAVAKSHASGTRTCRARAENGDNAVGEAAVAGLPKAVIAIGLLAGGALLDHCAGHGIDGARGGLQQMHGTSTPPQARPRLRQHLLLGRTHTVGVAGFA